jgi:hypothetical protein
MDDLGVLVSCFDIPLAGQLIRLMVMRLRERTPQGEDFARAFRGNYG